MTSSQITPSWLQWDLRAMRRRGETPVEMIRSLHAKGLTPGLVGVALGFAPEETGAVFHGAFGLHAKWQRWVSVWQERGMEASEELTDRRVSGAIQATPYAR